MTSEISFILKKAGLGVSTAVGIGGDLIIGSTYSDLLPLFEKDPETTSIVLFGEVGGTYEEQAAETIKKLPVTKPVVAFISGLFAETLPSGLALGHAGAIIEKGKARRVDKVEALAKSGVKIAKVPDEIPDLIKTNG